jgi:phage gp45-like
MLCIRTDQSKLYQLLDLTPTWIIIADLTKTITDKTYVDNADALKVNTSDVVTVATANKILKLNGSGALPANITGSSSSCTGNAATATTAKYA